MSLHHAAQHLAAHGRGPDTTLVHMSKDEVKSLNDIAMAHGGHLTINPHTGLPEAGFLSKMLPMIAGGALAATGVGAPLAAAIVGGGYTAATGSLKKGLMAGLGAYGGAGIGSALGASGAEQIAQNQLVGNPVINQAQAQAGQLAQSYANAANPSFMGPNMSPEIVAENASAITQPAVDTVNAVRANAAAGSGFGGEAYNASSGSIGNRLSTMGQGVSSLGSEAGRSAFMSNLGAVPGTYSANTTLAAAAAPLAFNDSEPQKPKTDSDPGQQYTYSANAVNPTPTPDPYGRERRYFNPAYTARAADGGLMARGGNVHGTLRPPPTFFQNGKYSFHPSQMYADGGLSDAQYNLGGYSDGGRLLRGPGDGVSDSIPATIGHKQPARLADGEFVVPARIVSELGNGSTEAGARRLYDMMDRIQKARSKTVGKNSIATNSKAEKYLPA